MSGTGLGIFLALLSSVTTASAHALLKSGNDKLAIRAIIGAVGSLALLPVCFLVPLPTPEMLPWLAASSLLHVVYQLVLIRAYEASDFAVAYPIARGIAPLATALLGMLLLGDQVTAEGLAGVGLISGGMLLIAAGRSMAISGLVAAALAGILTTAYTIVDAHAIRMAPLALTFVAWFFLLDGLIMCSIFAIVRRRQVASAVRSDGRQGVVAGLVSLIGFSATLLALRFAPTGIVSALRETSVVFATLIAAFILHEHVDRRRVAGAAVIVTGAIVIVTYAGLNSP